MGYVGNQQTEGFSQVPAKQDLTGATGTSLTLTHAVASAEGIDLFINNVRQEPTTAYSVGGDGVTVTLTGSVVATDDIYVVYNSLARQTSTHPSNQALQATSGAFSGDLTVDTTTLKVDSTNNRVGIGTTSPSSFYSLANNLVVGTGSGGNGMTIYSGSGDSGYIGFNDTASASMQGFIQYNHNGDYMAFAPNGSEKMRIDSSGNVGIGTSAVAAASAGTNVNIHSPSAYTTYLKLSNSSTGNGTGDGFDLICDTNGGGYVWTRENNHLYFGTNNTEAMRLTSSGHLGINNTAPSFPLVVTGKAANHCSAFQVATNGYAAALFYNASGTFVGQIQINASSTAYLTSSDYRLKTEVTYDWDATSRLKQLKPARFKWTAEGDDAVFVDGFLAHEVQDIVPEAISGTKDAVDEDGNPEYQSIDQSKLVPLLVRTIIELEARIAALEAS